jgi:hypothetical protein
MHLDEKSIQDLVGAIYDGVADPELWQHPLVRSSDLTRSMGAMFISMDRVHPMQSRYVLGRLDPDLMENFLTRHAGHIPVRPLDGYSITQDCCKGRTTMRKLSSTCRGSRLSRRGKAGAILQIAALAALVCLADLAQANVITDWDAKAVAFAAPGCRLPISVLREAGYA